MSSFKEIVFIVQKSHTESLGYERIAIELSKALAEDYTCSMRVIAGPPSLSTKFLPIFLSHFFYILKLTFLCISYSWKGDIVYTLGKDPALSIPILKWIFRKKVLAQIQLRHRRLEKKKGIPRMWERFQERLILKFADKVFVDSRKAQSYFQEEYNRKTYMTFYGANHINEWGLVNPQEVLVTDRKYAISYMPNSTSQALMALQAFAKYPKYDYYLILENELGSFSEEIQKFAAYSHIHLIEARQGLAKLFSNAYIYIHLEPTVRTRIRLIEAMSLGKFTLCFDTDFSQNLTLGEAFYFSNHSQLLFCLQRAVTQSHFDQGERMKALASRMSWAEVAHNIHEHLIDLDQTPVVSSLADLQEG